ncbi:MAG: FAD-binding oxidoreductase [Terracidiphilus sp.]
MYDRYEGREDLIRQLRALLPDPARVVTAPADLERLSHDFYWFSPILQPQLGPKVADVAVRPLSVDEIVEVLRLAFRLEAPVTARGAGTASSGQSVPLHGGILLDLSLLDRLEEITADGIAVCEAGTRMGVLECEARARGWELRCYPSTFNKATIGGFLAGGASGIGAVAHGAIRDFDTVQAVEIVTMEEEPQRARLEGLAAQQILHAWGTNGIITRVWLRLTPAVEWMEGAAVFDTFEEAFRFAEALAEEPVWQKRLVTVLEWPIPSFFTPFQQHVRAEKALVLFMVAASQFEGLRAALARHRGELTFSAAFTGHYSASLLSNYTWNHTTLWAMQADREYTYLQCVFEPRYALAQCSLLRERYGTDILFHFEFMKNRDSAIVPAAIPVVRFVSAAQLNEMVEYCRSIRVFVANPHVHCLEDSGRLRPDNLQLLAKQHYDHHGLLNPGKMRTFRTQG